MKFACVIIVCVVGFAMMCSPLRAWAESPVPTLQFGFGIEVSTTFSPDGTRLVVSLGDSVTRTARLYSLDDQEVLWSNDSHANMIRAVDFSPDGNWIVTSCFDGIVRVIDVETGDVLRSIEPVSASSFAISPDSALLLTNGGVIWNLANGELVRQFSGKLGSTSFVVHSPNGDWLVSGHASGTVRVWETASGRLLHSFEAHSRQISHAAFSANDGTLLTGSADGSVKWWDIETWEEIRSRNFPASQGLTVSLDQTRVLTSNGRHNRVFNLETGDEIQMFETFSPRVKLAFSPDGTQVAVEVAGGQVKVMPTDGGEEIHSLNTGHNSYSLVYSADGSRLLTLDGNGISVWDTTTWERVWRSPSGMQPGSLRTAVMSPDGTEVAIIGSIVLGQKGVISLWNVDSGQMLGVIASNYVRSGFPDFYFSAFSPDGHSIFVGDESVLVQWDKSVLQSVVPLKIRDVSRFRNDTFLTVDGPAAQAWKVHVQASTDLSSEDNWTEVSPIFTGIGSISPTTTLRFTWRSGPAFFRVHVLPE